MLDLICISNYYYHQAGIKYADEWTSGGVLRPNIFCEAKMDEKCFVINIGHICFKIGYFAKYVNKLKDSAN